MFAFKYGYIYIIIVLAFACYRCSGEIGQPALVVSPIHIHIILNALIKYKIGLLAFH